MNETFQTSQHNTFNLVLLFCPVRTGHFGQGTFVETVLSFVRKQKHVKITIISTDVEGGGMEVSVENREGMEHIVIPRPENGITLTTRNERFQLMYARRITDIIARYLSGRGHLVFWFNSIDFLNVAGALKERFSDAGSFYVHHAWSWKHFRNIEDDKFGEQLLIENNAFHPQAFEFTKYQKRMTEVVDKTVTVTKHARYFFERFLDVPGEKIHTIYNGMDPASVKTYNVTDIRKKYGIGGQEKIILYSGRMTYEKGIPFLLKAFKLIADKMDNVRLFVIGTGDIGRYIPLTSPHWGRVIYTGELPREDVFELYSIADVGVQPSLIEQCSFTAIEMCLHNIPLVVSGDIGLDEMFDDGVDALKVKVMYEPGEFGVKYLDHQEIADKITFLLNNPEKAAEIGRSAFRKAERLFNSKTMSHAYLQVMEELVKIKTGEPVAS